MLIFVAILFSYLGSLPAGMINLNVLYIELKEGRKASLAMAIGAALIEVIQGGVAVILYTRLVSFSSYEYLFRWGGIAVFFGLAIYYIVKSKLPIELPTEDDEAASPIIRGMLLSSANFLAVPFWLVVLAILNDKMTFKWELINMLIFSIGAGMGGVLASLTYIWIGRKLISTTSLVYKYLDYVLSAIFFLLGMFAILLK